MEAVKHEEVHLAVRIALSPAGKRDAPGREDAVLKRLAERRATIASGRGRRWFERARGAAQKAVPSAQIAAGEQERMLRGKPPCATCGHEVGRAAPLANEAQVLLCSFNEWGVSGPEWLLTEGAWWRAYQAWRVVVATRDALNDWAQKGHRLASGHGRGKEASVRPSWRQGLRPHRNRTSCSGPC